MHNVQAMQVLYSVHNLYKNPPCSPLLQPALIIHQFEELPLLCILQDQKYPRVCLNDFINVNDVRVTSCLHDLYLSQNPILIVLVLNGLFFNYFNGNLLIRRSVDSFLNFTKSSFS